jgi:hypothetical protein
MPSALWSSLATAEIPAGRSRECLNFSYHTQRGTQIKAVAQMINILAGGKNLLEIPAE